MGRRLRLDRLKGLEGLDLPEQVGDYVDLYSLASLQGLKNPNNLVLELPDNLLEEYNKNKTK